VVGSDGRVWTTWWRDDNGRWASWYGVGGSQAFALPFVPTTSPAFGPERALTQRPSTMENGRWIVSPLVEQYSLDPRLSPLPAIAVLSETIAPARAVRGETFWVLVAVHFFQAAPSYLLGGEHSFGILIRTPPQTVIPTGARVEYRHLNEDGTATAFDGSVLAFPGGTMRPTSRDDWWYIDCPDRDLFPPGWRVGRGRKMEIAVPLQATASATSPLSVQARVTSTSGERIGAELHGDVIDTIFYPTGFCTVCQSVQRVTGDNHCERCGSASIILPIFPTTVETHVIPVFLA